MTTEKLKALHGTLRMYAVDDLSYELIALWEAANAGDDDMGRQEYLDGVWAAVDALNAKASEVLK